MDDLPEMFGDAFDQVLPVVGRGVLGAGPDRSALRGKVSELLAAAIA
jgi:orotidine-5'-phosphate decarboxylase